MSLTGRNPTIRLSIIRSQIDKQQQVIALLENRLQEAILGGTDVGDIYGDGDLETILGQVARIYGDDAVTDSRFDYARNGNGEILIFNSSLNNDSVGNAKQNQFAAYDGQSMIYQWNPETGKQQLIAEDASLAGNIPDGAGVTQPYELFDENDNIDIDEYDRYRTDYIAAHGGGSVGADAFALNGAELTDTFTDLTGAMHKGVLDFQQVDSSGASLPLEQDGIRQLLYQARALMGELRVEEQHWNAEVNEEKSRRKELVEFTKG